MRRRNKKVNKHTRFTVNTAGVVAVLMTVFLVVMFYCALGMRCTSIARDLQQAEKEYKQLTKEGERVAARWTELMAVDRLQERLVRFGLEMNFWSQDQVVRLNAAGQPLRGQIAVTRARERLATANMAQMTPGTQSRKRSSRGKVR